MLISAFYADQANCKNRAVNAYHQGNAVLCLSARFMLISRTIWCVHCLSLWANLEIDLSRTDHFLGYGLSGSSFLFPPNVKVYVLDKSVLFGTLLPFLPMSCLWPFPPHHCMIVVRSSILFYGLIPSLFPSSSLLASAPPQRSRSIPLLPQGNRHGGMTSKKKLLSSMGLNHSKVLIAIRRRTMCRWGRRSPEKLLPRMWVPVEGLVQFDL